MRTDISRAASATFAANRAQGAVRFDVRLQDGVTRRGSLHESGSLRVRFPSPEAEGLSGVFVNTAGGIAGGDRFDIDIAAGEGARLTLTTAAAEKVYRAAGPAAQLNIALKAEAGAHLSWLPQETILFDRARIVRRIDIDLAADASLLLCEIVVFGRAAMGERMLHGEFVDRWRLRRGGRLVFAETVRLDGDIGEKLARPAVANGGVAIGTALIVPGDEALVERIREASVSGGEGGISAWNGFAWPFLCPSAAGSAPSAWRSLRRAAGGARPGLLNWDQPPDVAPILSPCKDNLVSMGHCGAPWRSAASGSSNSRSPSSPISSEGAATAAFAELTSARRSSPARSAWTASETIPTSGQLRFRTAQNSSPHARSDRATF
jgi:urease accessory protein